MVTRSRTRSWIVPVMISVLAVGAGSVAAQSASQSADEQAAGAKKTGQGVEDTAKGGGRTTKAGATEAGQRGKSAAPDAKAVVGDNLHDSAKRFGEAILGGIKFAGRTVIRFFTD
jgi:hypothetical protein